VSRELTPVPSGPSEGYFAKRATVLRVAGQANFDAQFNLNPDALVADETTVQAVLDDTDNWVRGRCYFYGVPKTDAVNYVAADDELLGYLHEPASRRARARGYLMRGEVGGAGGPNGAEGQMTAMRDQAEAEINDLLQAAVRRAADAAAGAAGNDGITVITPACYPCCLPNGTIG
jgi:hypothetical protein